MRRTSIASDHDVPLPLLLLHITVRVALKSRSLRFHPPRLCCFAVFFAKKIPVPYKPSFSRATIPQVPSGHPEAGRARVNDGASVQKELLGPSCGFRDLSSRLH